jgi:hypothetical protein
MQLIEELLSATVGAPTSSRVARRIEVRFGALEELRDVLDDIVTGRLTMTVAEPLVLYEDLFVTVPDLVGGELLTLHARVVNQRPDGKGYRVGLQFSEMRPEARRLVETLRGSVVEALSGAR